MNINKVFCVARLTRDPDIRTFGKDGILAKLALAINRRYKDSQTGEWKSETCFIDADCFGVTAQTARDYLHKGDPVHVEARLRMDEWEDKQTGEKRRKLLLVVERLTLFEKDMVEGARQVREERAKKGETTTAGKTTQPAGKTNGNKTVTARDLPDDNGDVDAEYDENSDEIPF